MRNLSGKVAFVTGGASGIGLGMVRAFLGEGMKVVVADYNPAHLADARAALAGSNAVHFIETNVAERARLRAAAEETLDLFGRIHLLCNNAGVAGGGTAVDPEFDDWDRAIAINLGGVVNGCKIVVPMIRAHGEGGQVVNTSSMAGMVPLPDMAAYSAAKYAVRGYTESLRLALAPEGIGVSCLYPGAVRSNLAPVPEDNSSAPAGEEGEFTRRFWDAMRTAMTPDEMGARVVAGIRDNRPHILTHPEFLEEVKARHRVIEEAFLADEVPEARSRFEQYRRDTVDRLLGLPVID